MAIYMLYTDIKCALACSLSVFLKQHASELFFFLFLKFEKTNNFGSIVETFIIWLKKKNGCTCESFWLPGSSTLLFYKVELEKSSYFFLRLLFSAKTDQVSLLFWK